MKRFNPNSRGALLNAAKKRFLRRLKSKHDKPKRRARKRRSTYNPLAAPGSLDIYMPQNRAKFTRFIADLKQRAVTSRKINISFRNTTRISAAAALLLVAQTDRLVRARPELRIRCTFPPVIKGGKHKNANNLVESALKQIGFFDIIGQHSSKQTNQPTVRMWRTVSEDTAKGELAASLLKIIKDNFSQADQRKLYRGAIEAISNCVEHAYPDANEQSDKRWWMLVGIDDEHISVIICDLGVGIPVTLPKLHDPSILQRIFNFARILDSKDADLIQASTYIKRTRTEMEHRGKGAADLRSIVSSFPSAHLMLRSNKGEYCILGEKCGNISKSMGFSHNSSPDGEREAKRNHTNSIGGTMVEWILNSEDLTA